MTKLSKLYLFGLLILVGGVRSPMGAQASQTTLWSNAIETTSFSWYAPKSELRDNEIYHDGDLLGGINIRGGGTDMHLRSKPDHEFAFLEGDRLNISIWVEGDIGIQLTDFNTDYHLLLFPVSYNGTNFFKLLFAEVNLLENLTKSTFINSSLTNSSADLWMKYNSALDVHYTWDPVTGLLVEKSVTAPSGKQLIVIQDKAPKVRFWIKMLGSIIFSPIGIFIFLSAVVVVIIKVRKRHK